MIFFTNIKSAIITVSVVGLLVFSPVFALTFVNQKAIADSAKQFIVEKTKEKYGEDITKNPNAEKAINFLKKKYQDKLNDVQKKTQNLDKLISEYIDALCQENRCNKTSDDKKLLKDMASTFYKTSLEDKFLVANHNLNDLLKNKAQEVLSNILTDLRIFSGTNLAIYAFILLTTLLAKPELLKALRLPTILLTITSFIAIFIYVCEQNWFYTVLYNNYWGVGYISLITFIFALLVDIAMNRGRVTGNLINSLCAITSH